LCPAGQLRGEAHKLPPQLIVQVGCETVLVGQPPFGVTMSVSSKFEFVSQWFVGAVP
jgi:hypothetical protein